MKLDPGALVALARQAGGTIVMASVSATRWLKARLFCASMMQERRWRKMRSSAPSVSGANAPFEQDPNYPIRLLVDIAIKALSPAINDPTTAVQTIDQLEDLLRRLGASDLNSGYATDENGTHRLMFPTPTWEDYLTLALAARPYGVRSAFLHLSGSSKPKRASRPR